MGVEMPWISSIAAILFFLTVLASALTSSVSLIEVGVAYLTEERGFKRWSACLLLFALTGAVGVVCSLSFGPLANIKLFGQGLFDFADTFASNVLLTLGGLLIVLFVGWKCPAPMCTTSSPTAEGRNGIKSVSIRYIS
jgi:Na+-dependent transporters of the SNF family